MGKPDEKRPKEAHKKRTRLGYDGARLVWIVFDLFQCQRHVLLERVSSVNCTDPRKILV